MVELLDLMLALLFLYLVPRHLYLWDLQFFLSSLSQPYHLYYHLA